MEKREKEELTQFLYNSIEHGCDILPHIRKNATILTKMRVMKQIDGFWKLAIYTFPNYPSVIDGQGCSSIITFDKIKVSFDKAEDRLLLHTYRNGIEDTLLIVGLNNLIEVRFE